ncbi:MAG: cytochrome c [Bdellovibrionaceae bacterium]|nr:cytochrome c [Pseudobdellovibrionaceae bacterium]
MTKNKDALYNKWGLRTFLFSYTASLLFMAYYSFIYEGIDLKEVKTEAVAAGAVKKTTTSQDLTDKEKANFWVNSPSWAAKGKAIFQINCVSCHGPEGKGDGPAAGALNPPPRDVVKGKWTKGGRSDQLFKTISNGIAGTSMAAFGHLSKEDRWALVHFIRSITTNKVKEDIQKLKQKVSAPK